VKHNFGEDEQQKFGSVLSVLLKKGADINAQNCAGDTPLMVAAKHGTFLIHMLY
jgi:ankyrin repeat protein